MISDHTTKAMADILKTIISESNQFSRTMTNNEEEIFYSDEDISDSELYQVCPLKFLNSVPVLSHTDFHDCRVPKARGIFLATSLRAFSATVCGKTLVEYLLRMFPTPCITRSIGMSSHNSIFTPQIFIF